MGGGGRERTVTLGATYARKLKLSATSHHSTLLLNTGHVPTSTRTRTNHAVMPHAPATLHTATCRDMKRSLRVCSVLPSATEALCFIGGGHLLVGRSLEDNYPQSITHLPVLTGQKTTFTTAADVDAQVSAALSGQSLYTIDEPLLRSLQPDVILTQDICSVCAIDLVRKLYVPMDGPQKSTPQPLVPSPSPLPSPPSSLSPSTPAPPARSTQVTVERLAATMVPRPRIVSLNPESFEASSTASR